MRRSRVEPDIQDVCFFAPFCTAATASRPFGQQFLGRMRVPGVRAFLFEPADHLPQRVKILEPLAALIAIEDHEGHAPYALPRNAPIGAMRNHLVNAFLSPFGRPLHFRNLIQGKLPESLGFGSRNRITAVVELDKPLFGGPEDHRIVAAPAVWVTMLKFALGHECSPCLQQLNNHRVRFKYGLTLILRQALRKTSLIIQWSVGLQAEFLTHCEVLGAMPRGRMHDAAPLLQGDMLAKNRREGRAIRKKGMRKAG